MNGPRHEQHTRGIALEDPPFLRAGLLLFTLRGAAQWALWVFANLLGFFNGWAMGRSFGLTVAEDLGASIGENGVLQYGLQLGTRAVWSSW